MMPKSEGRLYGIGVAAIVTTPAVALEVAGRSARFEILAQLRSSVQGQAVFQTEMVSRQHNGDQGNAVRFQHSELIGEVAVAEISMPGITIEETYLDQGERTAYALAFLDMAVARRDCELAYARLTRAAMEAVEQNTRPVAALASLYRLKKQADELSEVVTLLHPFTPCEELCGRIVALQQQLASSVETTKRQVTCGLAPHPAVSPEFAQIMRMQVEHAGCVWDENSPSLLIAARIETGKQRVGFFPRDFHVQRMTTSVTLRGADGHSHGSFSFAAKGIGTDAFTAKQSLQQNFAENFSEKLLTSKVGIFGVQGATTP